jgi:hypothetical protein
MGFATMAARKLTTPGANLQCGSAKLDQMSWSLMEIRSRDHWVSQNLAANSLPQQTRP